MNIKLFLSYSHMNKATAKSRYRLKYKKDVLVDWLNDMNHVSHLFSDFEAAVDQKIGASTIKLSMTTKLKESFESPFEPIVFEFEGSQEEAPSAGYRYKWTAWHEGKAYHSKVARTSNPLDLLKFNAREFFQKVKPRVPETPEPSVARTLAAHPFKLVFVDQLVYFADPQGSGWIGRKDRAATLRELAWRAEGRAVAACSCSPDPLNNFTQLLSRISGLIQKLESYFKDVSAQRTASKLKDPEDMFKLHSLSDAKLLFYKLHVSLKVLTSTAIWKLLLLRLNPVDEETHLLAVQEVADVETVIELFMRLEANLQLVDSDLALFMKNSDFSNPATAQRLTKEEFRENIVSAVLKVYSVETLIPADEQNQILKSWLQIDFLEAAEEPATDPEPPSPIVWRTPQYHFESLRNRFVSGFYSSSKRRVLCTGRNLTPFVTNADILWHLPTEKYDLYCYPSHQVQLVCRRSGRTCNMVSKVKVNGLQFIGENKLLKCLVFAALVEKDKEEVIRVWRVFPDEVKNQSNVEIFEDHLSIKVAQFPSFELRKNKLFVVSNSEAGLACLDVYQMTVEGFELDQCDFLFAYYRLSSRSMPKSDFESTEKIADSFFKPSSTLAVSYPLMCVRVTKGSDYLIGFTLNKKRTATIIDLRQCLEFHLFPLAQSIYCLKCKSVIDFELWRVTPTSVSLVHNRTKQISLSDFGYEKELKVVTMVRRTLRSFYVAAMTKDRCLRVKIYHLKLV